jgi:hypothetical protein
VLVDSLLFLFPSSEWVMGGFGSTELDVLTEFEDGMEVGREDTQGKAGIGGDELSALENMERRAGRAEYGTSSSFQPQPPNWQNE